MKNVLIASEGETTRRPICLQCVKRIRNRINSVSNTNGNGNGSGLRNSNSNTQCIICLEKPKTTVLMPCKHQCCCANCSKEVFNTSKMCPFCRTQITEIINVFIV